VSDPTSEAYARIDAWVESAQQRATQAQQVRQDLESRRTRAESRDGLVGVAVNAQGVPTELDIDDRAMNRPGPELAATVLATMRDAQQRMTADVRAVATSRFGEGSSDADAIVDAYRGRFGTPEDRDR
jgi:DNA-binding protein YbaB